jgi:pre-mRNA-processing factor 17
MAALVSGYGSSDDEDSISPVEAITYDASAAIRAVPGDNEEEGEEDIEQAKKDLYGLSNQNSKAASKTIMAERGVKIKAAADVLAEVSIVSPCQATNSRMLTLSCSVGS